MVFKAWKMTIPNTDLAMQKKVTRAVEVMLLMLECSSQPHLLL